MSSRKRLTVLFVLTLFAPRVMADVRLPALISSNMVLQQNTRAPIWGWADAGEKISLRASWLTHRLTTVANSGGEWQVLLPTPAAGGPYKLIITGNNRIVLDNILSGEVWFASGQSNMAMAVEKCRNGEDEITTANYPDIRLFHVARQWAAEPQADCQGYWTGTTPETIRKFSGVAYFFARSLYNAINVPVGIISASKGGSPIESWIAGETLKADPDFEPVFALWKKWEAEYPEANKKYRQARATWEKEKKRALALNRELPESPIRPEAVHQISRPHKRPGHNYNGMVAPIVPFAIKGFIWYQGESNVSRPEQYAKLFQTLITGWRQEWGRQELPFYFVQIAPYRYKEGPLKASHLREAQAQALLLPRTGMVVTTDVGDMEDVHPKNKQVVGQRLAQLALAKTYGFDTLVYSGPVYKSMQIEGSAIRLYFEHTGSGLMSKGSRPVGFEIAGKDKVFVPANAIIDGRAILVSSEEVKHPVAVRFAWCLKGIPDFFNKEGLPAAPFRTDGPK